MKVNNHVQLIGNLGKAPELKSFENGKTLANASLAVDNIYRNQKGEKVSGTQWMSLTAWDKTAELMESLCEKGTRIMVFGRLNTGSYEDKEGAKRYYTKIIVNNFVVMNGLHNQ